MQTGVRRHPHASRKDEVWTIKTAGSIVEWLERNWGANGLVVLRGLTHDPGHTASREQAMRIANNLIPEVPGGYSELYAMVEANQSTAGSADVAKQEAVAEQIL